MPANGSDHGAETNLEQLHGAGLSVSIVSASKPLFASQALFMFVMMSACLRSLISLFGLLEFASLLLLREFFFNSLSRLQMGDGAHFSLVFFQHTVFVLLVGHAKKRCVS